MRALALVSALVQKDISSRRRGCADRRLAGAEAPVGFEQALTRP